MNAQEGKSFTVSFTPGTLIITIGLTILSFVLGSLWTSKNYLESSSPAVAKAPTNNAPAAPAAPGVPEQALKTPELTDKEHFKGNKNAKIVLVEYSDYDCPFCKQFHPTMKQVIEEYGDKVKWVYRHFPLFIHPNAQKVAEAAECVAKAGGEDAFWKFTDAYYESGTGTDVGKLGEFAATKAGVNGQNVQSCIDSGEMAQQVKDSLAKGTEEGINGTPGTIIIDAKGNTQIIPGALPFDQVKPMIDSALKA